MDENTSFGDTWFGGVINTVIGAAADRYRTQTAFNYAPAMIGPDGRPMTQGQYYYKQSAVQQGAMNDMVVIAGALLVGVLLFKLAK